MRNRTFFILFILLAVGLAACGGGAPKVDWQLKIGGAVDTPLTLTYDELAKMPQVDLKDILMQRSQGEDTLESWAGVSLAEILGKAGASADYVGITATAADGYAVEITKDELQDAIVALKQNGEWIATADEEHGPIRLICPNTPANRWVFELQEIQVNE
jgi:DMSO/TMAO reductase YedYZ molybdopterin-dependent catalytic subunit